MILSQDELAKNKKVKRRMNAYKKNSFYTLLETSWHLTIRENW